jgi:uncharacterized FlaG/YvyC family protein
MMNGIPFWYGMGKAAAMGAISGAISFGIGSAVTSTATSFIGKAALQAALHGYSGGVMSALEGGNFMSGFAAGAVSSIISSAIQASGTNFKGTGAVQDINRNYTSLNSFCKSGLHKVVMIVAGGLSGGFSSAIAGGNFWQGVKQGIITSGLNHATNHVVAEIKEGIFKGKLANQLKEAGYDLTKVPDMSKEALKTMIEKVPELNRIYSKINGNVNFHVVDKLENAYGETIGKNVYLSKGTITTNYALVVTLGHEMIHVYHNINFRSHWKAEYSDGSGRKSTLISEAEVYTWEIEMGVGGLENKTPFQQRNIYLDNLKTFRIDYTPKKLY